MAILDTNSILCDSLDMADRQTRNVSLPPHQDAFVEALVAAGRYRTASEVMRDGLRLLEEAEHRRLAEKWVYAGLTEEEEARLPSELKERLKQRMQGLVDSALREVADGRVKDGPSAMKRLESELRDRLA